MNTGPYSSSAGQHRWGRPLAGQGSERVCTSCGVRESQAPDVCQTPGRVEAYTTTHEYDPLDG